MDNIILTEAFKELKLLEEEAFDIDSPTGIDDAKEYLEDEIVDDTLDVADVYAEEEEEVLDSYIGQVVLDCNVCHSKIFEDPDKVEIDEESQTANMEEECPYCFSMDGYKVIGQVAPMGQVEEEIEVTEEEPVEDEMVDDIEPEVPEEEVAEDEIVEESFRRKRRGKKINESRRTRKNRKINESVEVADSGEEPYLYFDEVEDFEDGIVGAPQNLGDAPFKRFSDIDMYYYATANGEDVGDLSSEVPQNIKSQFVKACNNYASDHPVAEVEKEEDEWSDEGEYVLLWVRGLHKEEDEWADWKDSDDLAFPQINTWLVDKDFGRVDMYQSCSRLATFNHLLLKFNSKEDAIRYFKDKCEEDRKLWDEYGYIVDVCVARVPRSVAQKSLRDAQNREELWGLGTVIYRNYEMKNESLNECGKFKKGKCRNDALKEGDSCPECGKNPCECEKDLEEDFKDVSITTDDSHMTMTSDEDGKVTVTTEPVNDIAEDEFVEDEIDNGEEMLAPVDDETVAEIKDEVVDEPLEDEEPVEDEVEDIDIDEFDEEGFDELGESYLKKVYENVNSFKTTGIKEIKNKLCIEGLINFKSGNTKKTSFLFEAKDVDSKGKIRFIGENKEITRGKKSFTVAGRMRGKKFMCESLNYNYRAKDEKGKSTRLYGTIKRA